MDSRPQLSVIVPVYNEVATVRTLLERVMAVRIPKEIIVVDDGSTDGTPAALEEVRPPYRTHPTTASRCSSGRVTAGRVRPSAPPSAA